MQFYVHKKQFSVQAFMYRRYVHISAFFNENYVHVLRLVWFSVQAFYTGFMDPVQVFTKVL